MYPNYQQQYYDNILQNIDYKFYEKFDNDIYDEVNNIQRALDLTKDERNYALAKLQVMCEEVFTNQSGASDNSLSPKKPSNSLVEGKKPKIQQFGSLITGLALKSSDMDMAVTNLFLPDREKMVESLDIFAENLRKWELIQDLNAISTASIPVIKANVDLNMLRKEMN
jgi:poly(A) polymerase Pap1